MASLVVVNAQTQVFGVVVDSADSPIAYATIQVKETMIGTLTDEVGTYKITLGNKGTYTLIFSCLGYKDEQRVVSVNREPLRVDINLTPESTSLIGVNVSENRLNNAGFTTLNTRLTTNLPSSSGNAVEELIMTLPGVATNNELSSQYSVRGGNFDENLVYVNDIEIYRPLLIKSGQQEGLSFINSDLVGSIDFSAGGFDASYGDKMSSVLDINYKRPTEFKTSASVSMLGASAHLETLSKNQKFMQLHGVRYKTSKYLLNSLNTKGEYAPAFLDYQTWLSYKFSDKTELSFLGNYSSNTYEFTPESRETKFGTYDLVRSLKVYFDGWEQDKFTSGTGALSLHYRPKTNISLKFIASTFATKEEETYDVIGEYWINEVDMASSSSTVGDSINNIGVGGYMRHARNYLSANVYSFQHKGLLETKQNVLQWGGKIQSEVISDEISEWEVRDSAGYSIPYADSEVTLYVANKPPKLDLNSTRADAYVLDSYAFGSSLGRMAVTGGVRASYWSFNDELLVSPRVSLFLKPHWTHDWSFNAAWGVYYQAPFYKEIRSRSGVLNTGIKSQRSIQYVLGGEYKFDGFGRPFKYTIEAYYKDMDNLIPYDVNNVQIVYYGDNLSSGYTTGLDMRIFGEFVPGVDSWFSLSFMKSEEDLANDSYVDNTGETIYPGSVSRPTDQKMRASIFFQDYFPNNPNYRVHLKVIYGSRLPFGPPNGEKYQMNLKMPAYRRADVGITRNISNIREDGSKRLFDSMSLGLEVFNLFDISNTNSYFWVTDVYNNMYAVPNYLTGRRLNFKMAVTF